MAVQDSATVCPQCDRHLHDPITVTLSDVLTPPRIASVSIVDVTMPFGSMVFFLVKWTLAAFVAGIILAICAVPLFVLVTLIIGS